jgi:O-acetylserine/cysteine efflux transporter
MRPDRRATLLALAAAGVLWGTTVPLTKVALGGWGPAWLTVARFGLAALPLAVLGRRHLRAALTPGVVGAGVLGFGAVIVLQNAGIARTSVSHAALLIGATPAVMALCTVAVSRIRVRGLAWLGFALALAGAASVSAGDDGAATGAGDALVIASVLLAAVFLVRQPRLLHGRDPVAVTAVQLAAGAIGSAPAALLLDGAPAAMPGAGPLAALAGLVVAGTLVPYALFAWAQARIAPEIAGAFLNLEPPVGVLLGAMAFGDPVGPVQIAGGAAILAGIVLSASAPVGESARSAEAQPLTHPAGSEATGACAAGSASLRGDRLIHR